MGHLMDESAAQKIIERKIRNNSWPVLMNLVAASVFLK